VDCCEHENALLGSIKGREFCDRLTDRLDYCEVPKKGYVPFS
jgi:hypothetical protein